jgi:hypothetical protein
MFYFGLLYKEQSKTTRRNCFDSLFISSCCTFHLKYSNLHEDISVFLQHSNGVQKHKEEGHSNEI